LVFVASPLST